MNLIILPSIDSTNSYAQLLIQQEKATEGTVVLALEQSAGRGQRGKKWESDKGMGLLASIVLMPEHTPASNQFLLNKAIAVGVAAYLESKTGKMVKVKWPNDLLIDNEKVAGILIESNLRGAFFYSLVVGIGINLNQQFFHETFDTPPTSLGIHTGKSFLPETEVFQLYDFVWERYRQFVDGHYDKLSEAYRSRIYKKDELAGFMRDGKLFFAILKDVDDDGAAVLMIDEKITSETHPRVRFANDQKI